VPAKAELLGIARTAIEDAVLTGHRSRVANTGSADWSTTTRRLVVAGDHRAHGGFSRRGVP